MNRTLRNLILAAAAFSWTSAAIGADVGASYSQGPGGYFRKDDRSGPYSIDSNGNATLIGAPSAGAGSGSGTAVTPTVGAQEQDVRNSVTLSTTTANAAVVIPVNGQGTVGLTFTGLTASGAVLTYEQSNDNGNTYTGINEVNAGTGVPSATRSTDGQTRVSVSGRTMLRVRVSTPGTGNVTVAYNLSVREGLVTLASPLPPGVNNIGSVNVANQPAVQPVSGTVGINNLPTTQTTMQQDGLVPAGSPFSASAISTLFTVDTLGYSSVAVQISGTYAATVAYEASNDQVSWFGAAGNLVANAGSTGLSASDTGTGIRTFPVTARYFRARVSAYTSGTVVAAPILRAIQDAKGAVYVGGGTIGLAGGTVVNVGAVQATNGVGGLTTPSRIVASAATVNATLAKATAGRVYKITGYNNSTTLRWLRFFNNAATPVPGTTAAFFSVPLAPGTFSFDAQDIGYYFSAGIGYAITASPADNDNTPVAANDVFNLNVWYQ
jgi:hypothetical protein